MLIKLYRLYNKFMYIQLQLKTLKTQTVLLTFIQKIILIKIQFFLKRKIPLLVDKFQLPSRSDADAKLIFGASIFGIGWGIAGLCPGPAIASISFGGNNSIIFVVTMTITIFIYRYINTKV